MKKLLVCLMMMGLLLVPLFGLAEEASECAHERTWDQIEFTDWDAVTYTAIDNRDHMATGMGTIQTYCRRCGKLVGESEEKELQEKYSHSYDENGVCLICGHKNTCKHTDTYTYTLFEQDDRTYTSIDNKYHMVHGAATIVTECNECYTRISEETTDNAEEKEWHEYDETGKCSRCGHVNDCKHLNTYDSFSWAGEMTYTSVDNRYHMIKGSGYPLVFCDDCGQRISEGALEEHEEKGWHNYDDNGVCRSCGHKNDCEHANTHESFHWTGEIEYISVDNRVHIAKGSGYPTIYCEDCGQNISKGELEQDHEEESWHYYDEKGVCYNCGHVNDCKHANTYNYFSFDEQKTTFTAIDNRYHLAKGAGYLVTYCEDCGQQIEREPVDSHEEEENHWYDGDGKCSRCGHQNTCKHENKSTGEYIDDPNPTYKALNALYHSATGKGYRYEACEDCGLSFEYKEVDSVTEKSQHSFGKDGKCTYCGYVNACKHDGSKWVSTWYEGSTKTTDDGNGVTHTVTGSGTDRVICSKCGATLSEKKFTNRSTKTTHWDDGSGRCYECGATLAPCKHENKNTETYITNNNNMTYKPKDAKYHTVSGDEYEQTWCDDCGRWLGNRPTGKTGSRDETHSFINGVCVDCGYTSTCTHEHNHTYRYITKVESISDIDETGHTLNGALAVYTYCDDCGDTISGSVRYNQTLREPHYVENGICTTCGYKSTCDHANKVQKTGIYNPPQAVYTAIDANSHQATGVIFTYEECTVCGQTFNYQYPEEGQEQTGTVVEDHKFVNGKCIDCGYGFDTSLIEDFVTRCYQLILGRDPDIGGLRNWTNALSAKTQNASEIIGGFMNSEEYLNRNSSSEETVEILYNTMLDRGSDPAGKAGWVEKLNESGSSNTVINGFCGSQEFLGICDVYGIEAGSIGQDNTTGTGLKGFVERCYKQALGRTSDEGGLDYWCNILTNKEQTPIEVAGGFVFSPEMNAAAKIQEDPDALLDSLYRLYLGREADEGGKDYWKQKIQDGMTMEELNDGFAYSAEFSGIVESFGLGE